MPEYFPKNAPTELNGHELKISEPDKEVIKKITEMKGTHGYNRLMRQLFPEFKTGSSVGEAYRERYPDIDWGEFDLEFFELLPEDNSDDWPAFYKKNKNIFLEYTAEVDEVYHEWRARIDSLSDEEIFARAEEQFSKAIEAYETEPSETVAHYAYSLAKDFLDEARVKKAAQLCFGLLINEFQSAQDITEKRKLLKGIFVDSYSEAERDKDMLGELVDSFINSLTRSEELYAYITFKSIAKDDPNKLPKTDVLFNFVNHRARAEVQDLIERSQYTRAEVVADEFISMGFMDTNKDADILDIFLENDNT